MDIKNILIGFGALAGTTAITALVGVAAAVNKRKKSISAEPAPEPAAAVNTVNGVPITTIAASRFLTMYEVAAQALASGKEMPPWRFVSRRGNPDELPAVTHNYKPDAVAIVATWYDDTQKPQMVLIRQYRAPVSDYVIELPAGLVENGEVALNTALRETFEETGLTFVPNPTAKMQLGFSSIGMTDECIGLGFGECTGTPSHDYQETAEDIEVILADVEMCKQLLADTENHPCDIRALFAMRNFVMAYDTP